MTGQYGHNIDAKGRLFIPARLREELGQTFHVTVGLDHCLSIYSDESWATFTDKVRALPYSKAKALRPLFANAVDCEPDAQGRILIPTKLREYAGLQKEVVVIGSFDRAEIWNAERWAKEEWDCHYEILASGLNRTGAHKFYHALGFEEVKGFKKYL